jgi:putative methyltransferase
MQASLSVSPDFAALTRDLPRTSPRAWRFAALATGSRAGGLLSDGLRIGHEHGFDSGPFMEHVYANRPSGRTPLGRVLDRRLLNRRTCQAFREIRGLAEIAVLAAIDAAGDGPVIADLAAGSSPYLLHALAERPNAKAVLSDLDPAALEQASAAARARGVADRVRVRRADAFDVRRLTDEVGRVDVVLELGLYGIYHDDALIERHFADIGRDVAPSQIVCNVQVANPEIEYIARVWRNHEGERCVWRLRPASQILAYAAAAGYDPADETADTAGIYRVLRLQRRPEAAAP